ncbi:MAG: type II toxin-antitoxin system HicB family antitoxin [Candidatus Wolfebacteria bacterium]|nr:type II toxin-antitoxin system HicB family antitoxin [Candidatus Wolfebacteria bacterium]
MKKISLQNVVWKEGKYHVAQCLNVDVSSFGKTKKEALDNIQEAIELYFEGKKGFRITIVKKPVIVERQFQYV